MVDDSFLLFSGSSHPHLSREIAEDLKVVLGKAQITNFPDGEIGVQVLENVRGRDVFVIQSIARDPNLYLMELLIFIDALKRASARRIVAVIPYYGYARQDRKDKRGVSITAKLVADLLEKAGVDRVVTMDLHAEQIQGFFTIPVDHLYAYPILIKALRQLQCQDPIVTAPDIGSVKLARIMANEMGVPFAIVEKQRVNSTDVRTCALIGNVQNKNVILVDDVCASGSTLIHAALACKRAGAYSIFAAITHGLFLGKIFLDKIISRFFVTNTIPLPNETDLSRIDLCNVAAIFGRAIKLIVNNGPENSLFRPTT